MVSFVIDLQTWIKDYDSNSHVEEENSESDEEVASGSPIHQMYDHMSGCQNESEEEEMIGGSLETCDHVSGHHEMTDGSLAHEINDVKNVGLLYSPLSPQFSPPSTAGELGSPKREEDFC